MPRQSAAEQANARRERAEARARRLDGRSEASPRALNVDVAAIKRRDELAAELLSYYEFLTALYLPADCIKRPPKGGWPSITAERLAFLGKTDAVVDLLKHIPYISQDVEDRLQIFEKCICTDYTGIPFETQAAKHHDQEDVDPLSELLEDDVWDRLNAMQHIATLARSASRNGHYIMVDTRDGQLATIDFMDGRCHTHDTPKKLCDNFKDYFRRLDIFPKEPRDVRMVGKQSYSDAQIDEVKAIFMKHGWPAKEFQREECMAEVASLWKSFTK